MLLLPLLLVGLLLFLSFNSVLIFLEWRTENINKTPLKSCKNRKKIHALPCMPLNTDKAGERLPKIPATTARVPLCFST